MAVTYTKEQKAYASNHGTHLVTISVAGMEFQGEVTEDERDNLVRYYLDFTARRRMILSRQEPCNTEPGSPE